MTYLTVFFVLSGLLLAWYLTRIFNRRRHFSRRQDRLSSSFDRSQSTRTYGPGAQGITQNILIANLTSSRRFRGNSA